MAKLLGSHMIHTDYSAKDWAAQEDRDIEQYAQLQRQIAKNAGKESDIIGETIKFPMADSYAVYMVGNASGALIHLAVGDGWSIPDAHIRGLRKSDIVAEVNRARLIKELFAKKKELV